MSIPAQEGHGLLIESLPGDWREARLLGRVQLPQGPTPVLIENGRVYDLSSAAPTVAQAAAHPDLISPRHGVDLGPLESMTLSPLSPIDLQVIKASGVTFAVSALERVIDERARGNFALAQGIRANLAARVGADALAVEPGSEPAARLKEALIAEGLWSQYLEVAIGRRAGLFREAGYTHQHRGDVRGRCAMEFWNHRAHAESRSARVTGRAARALGAVHEADTGWCCWRRAPGAR